MITIIETDSQGGAVLPGHPNQWFLVQEHEDGSILLQPAVVVSKAQLEHDTNPELRELLARAGKSPNVKRSYQRRTL